MNNIAKELDKKPKRLEGLKSTKKSGNRTRRNRIIKDGANIARYKSDSSTTSIVSKAYR